MSPVRIARRTVPAEGPTDPPTTWGLLTMLGGAAWFTYGIYNSSKRLWIWIHSKVQAQAQKNKETLSGKPGRLFRREVSHEHPKVKSTSLRSSSIVPEEAMGSVPGGTDYSLVVYSSSRMGLPQS
jgi:hypothetical protein